MASEPEVTRLVKSLKINLPGAIEDAIQLAMYEVVDEFLDDTNVWREEVTFTTRSGLVEYEIDPESAARVTRLVGLVGSADQNVPATMEEPGTVVLRNEPSQEEEHTATISLRLRTTTSDGYPYMPSWIWRKYRDGLLSGVLGRMMSQPAKPYSNEKLSVLHMRKFSAAKTVATAEANRKNLYGGQNWQFPRWA